MRNLAAVADEKILNYKFDGIALADDNRVVEGAQSIELSPINGNNLISCVSRSLLSSIGNRAFLQNQIGHLLAGVRT